MFDQKIARLIIAVIGVLMLFPFLPINALAADYVDTVWVYLGGCQVGPVEDWTEAITCSASYHATCFDEENVADDDDFLFTSILGREEGFQFYDPPDTTDREASKLILGVRIDGSAVAGNVEFRREYFDWEIEDYAVCNNSRDTITTESSYTIFNWEMTTDPCTGAAWLWIDIVDPDSSNLWSLRTITANKGQAFNFSWAFLIIESNSVEAEGNPRRRKLLSGAEYEKDFHNPRFSQPICCW